MVFRVEERNQSAGTRKPGHRRMLNKAVFAPILRANARSATRFKLHFMAELQELMDFPPAPKFEHQTANERSTNFFRASDARTTSGTAYSCDFLDSLAGFQPAARSADGLVVARGVRSL